jgi:hypothetical protein
MPDGGGGDERNCHRRSGAGYGMYLLRNMPRPLPGGGDQVETADLHSSWQLQTSEFFETSEVFISARYMFRALFVVKDSTESGVDKFGFAVRFSCNIKRHQQLRNGDHYHYGR